MSNPKTKYDPPPIPDRRFDWSAVHDDYDGAEDSGSRNHIGYGQTESEALADLGRLDQERADWQLGEACAQGTCGCPVDRCELDEESEFGP